MRSRPHFLAPEVEMRRWLPALILAPSAAIALALLSAPATEAPAAAPPAEPAVAVRGVPIADAEPPPQPIALPRPGDGALARIDDREARVDETLARLVDDGEISEDEARQLRVIALGTLDDARVLAHRVRDGEIGWIGGAIRGIPLRIRHVSAVVNVLGTDRARVIGERLRDEERARRLEQGG